MISTPFPSKTTPWRVQVPGRYFPDKKRKTRYFATKEEADKFVSKVERFGLAAVNEKPVLAEQVEKYAPLIVAALEKLGNDPAKLFEAIDYYQKTRADVRPVTVREAVEQFSAARKTRKKISTWRSDNGRLRKLANAFEFKPLSEVTETDLRGFFDGIKGHSRSIYKTVNVFFGWAKQYNFVGVNPMTEIKPTEAWGKNKGLYPVETFGRMLRIAAGLEGVKPGQAPTLAFIDLLPWFVLSGFCGLRTCEAYRADGQTDAIRWDDLYFERGFIKIREEVAKQTQKDGRDRYIKTRAYLEPVQAWLALVPRKNPFVVRLGLGRISKLKAQFSRQTGIRFVENGLRNSFASYALTFDGELGVGKLAIEMGNSEAVAKAHYIESLEPGSGRAWFGLRPDTEPANVIPIDRAAAA